MKVCLVVSLVGLCGYIGYALSCNYKQRKRFFSSFFILLQNLKLDMKFSSTKLPQILVSLKNTIKNKDIKRLLENYEKAIKTLYEEKALFVGIEFLNKQEIETIANFFKSLGKSDVENQIELISNMQSINENFIEKCKIDCDRYCSLYTKLGVLIGIFVALIIV